MTRGDSLKRRLKLPFPLRGIEQRIYAAVLLSLLFGVWWSVVSRDWQYFERSGSLVIIVGVGITWHDHVNLLGRVEDFYRAQYSRLLADFDSQRPAGIIAGGVHDGKRAELEQRKSNAEELIQMLKRRVRTTEAFVVCLGTTVWGYGSIVGNFLWSFR